MSAERPLRPPGRFDPQWVAIRSRRSAAAGFRKDSARVLWYGGCFPVAMPSGSATIHGNETGGIA
jgi:hypothetical protein